MPIVQVIEDLARNGRKVSERRLESLTDQLDREYLADSRISTDTYEHAHRLLQQLDGER